MAAQYEKTKWNFIEHPGKENLDVLEVNYWKSLLFKLLKVGAELEFNLPSVKGICKKINFGCGCIFMMESDCWMDCANESFCVTTATKNKIKTCANKQEDCNEDLCATCAKYKFKCTSLACSNFLPHCISCGEFVQDCDNCKFAYDNTRDPDNIRQQFKNLFSPNNCYGTINKSGVHSIKTDGSLLGGKGAEIITIGRRVDFWEFHQMFKNIIDNAVDSNAYVNERCSIHMHLLASYYDNSVESQTVKSIPNSINELEKSMPDIILTNFHQLIRKYQNAITWMAMGLDKKENLTRWEKYRVSVLDISPVLLPMRAVAEKVYKKANNSKYGFVDYRFCNYDADDSIKKFHIEIRALDAILCPSALAAFACLYQALLIKAVEISRWGVLEFEAEQFNKSLAMKEIILNGSGGWDSSRFSNTKRLLAHKDYFIDEAIDMVQQVKHILLHTGPAYDTLEKIAKNPVALRRMEGKEWQEIEDEICPVRYTEQTDLEKFVDEAIDLRVLTHCEDLSNWATLIAELAIKENVVEDKLEDIAKDINNIIINKFTEGEAIWSSSVGTVVSI